MADWYYAINGQQYGPVSDRELHDLAGDGSIQPTDLLWREGFTDWSEASTVAGLFPRGAAPPLPPSLQSTVPGKREPLVSESRPAFDDNGHLDDLELEPIEAELHPRGGRSGGNRNQTPDDLKIPVLVSGISNIVYGAGLTFTCFLSFLGVPMLILAAYELKLFGKADSISVEQFASEAKRLSIFQVILGLINTPSLICGIVVMVQAGKYEHPRGIPA